MMKSNWSSMTKTYFCVKYLIKKYIIDIVRPSETDRLKQDGVLTSIKDLDTLVEDGTVMLRNTCNE